MNVRALLLVTALAACGSKEEAPAKQEPIERISVADPIGYCERARILIMGRRKCFPEDTSLQMALDELARYAGTAPKEPEPRREVAKKCARMLDGLMRVQQPKDCPFDVLDSEREELTTFLARPATELAPKP